MAISMISAIAFFCPFIVHPKNPRLLKLVDGWRVRNSTSSITSFTISAPCTISYADVVERIPHLTDLRNQSRGTRKVYNPKTRMLNDRGNLEDEDLTLCYAYSINPTQPNPPPPAPSLWGILMVALMAGRLAREVEISAGILGWLFGTEIGDQLEVEIR